MESCKEHKKNDMKYVYRITFCKCGKNPCMNFPGEKKAICCTQCAEEGMVDIKSKKCKCGKIPSFNFPM